MKTNNRHVLFVLNSFESRAAARFSSLLGVCMLLGLGSLHRSHAASLGEALDNTNLLWTTSGTGIWSPQISVTHDGVDAARSGPVSDDQESWLQTIVNGPGTLAFWWRVSSEQNFDWLRFHIDGVLQHQISGEVNWLQRSYSIPSGLHVLRWRYTKDLYDAFGQDTGWLDDVRFTPASGPPVIVAQPVNQSVWWGANVTMSATALGEPPLSHQWYFNQTHPISGATQPAFSLHNIGSAFAGSYQLVVSNAIGSVTSSVVNLTVTNNGPATSVLLYVDGPYPSPYETALTQLGRPFQKFTSAVSFNQAVGAANRNTTLVVVDATYYINDLSSVRIFVGLGGRALVQAYSLIADASLAFALQVIMERRFTVPPPVYDWRGSLCFMGLRSPLNLTDSKFIENGQKLHALTGAHAVAGFATTTKPGEAAVVIGNAGRTIVNGFFLEDLASSSDAVRFAQNQIEFLINPLLPIHLLPPTQVGGNFQINISGGRAGLSCSIQQSANLANWNTVTNITLSGNPASITVPLVTDRAFFRLVTPPMP